MREQIINALFEMWCDGEILRSGMDHPQAQRAINGIGEHFQAAGQEKLFVEEQIMNAVSSSERNAFIQGCYTILELMNGNVFAAE